MRFGRYSDSLGIVVLFIDRLTNKQNGAIITLIEDDNRNIGENQMVKLNDCAIKYINERGFKDVVLSVIKFTS